MAAQSGALRAVAAALVSHPSNDHVLTWACLALLRLTHSSAERTQLAIAAGAKEALRAARPSPTKLRLVSVVDMATRWLDMHSELMASAFERHDGFHVLRPPAIVPPQDFQVLSLPPGVPRGFADVPTDYEGWQQDIVQESHSATTCYAKPCVVM